MPLYYGVEPAEQHEKQEPPKLDTEKLEAIQEESEHLAEMIKHELIEIKQKKQNQKIDGAEVYHKLSNVYKTIYAASEIIDRIIERG